ncbi:hypothetical protein PENSPDRAFT_657527 [Peniophora sp. CONT]|nr:hypothetical protein PENSPDRAFT_657527 [Peniophora sp. CONT]
MTPLIAMYPTLVVILVATRRSVLERGIVSGNASSGLRFATNPGSVRGDHDSTSSRCPTCHRIELETAVIGSCSMKAAGSSERDTVAGYDQDEKEKYNRAMLMSLAPAGPQLSRTESSGG